MEYKLRKKEVLHRAAEFRRVCRAERGKAESGLVLKKQPNSLGFNRLGIIIPKRIMSRATERNRLKRYLREVYRLNKHRIEGSYDIVIILRNKDTLILGFREIEQLFLRLLKKQGLLSRD